jgi:hypothetical protein
MTKEQALAAIWRETHSDFKSTLDGRRSIMVYRNGSTIVPLDQLTEAEIADRVKDYRPTAAQRG